MDKQGPRHVKSFREALALSSRRLGFSVTQGCPLKCGHCSVGASPELHANRYGRSFGQEVVRQMPAIADTGIWSIDFTGGEPTLLMGFVGDVSAAAAEFDISCGIVTAAHWARTREQARRTLRCLRNIDHWDISTDVYHTDFVRLDAVERAYEMLKDEGKSVIIRIAYHEPMTRDDAVLIDAVMAFAGRDVSFQPIGPVGRGSDITQSSIADAESYDRGPCPTTGPLIQWDGRVAPCCAPASHEMHDHALWLGSAHCSPIADIVRRWRIDPLLQTIRVWGFEIVRNWFAEAGVEGAHILRSRTCDTCVEMLRDPTLLAIAVERAGTLSHRVRLAYALLEEFDEPWLDELLRREAAEYLRVGAWPARHFEAA
ncbi:radical SAM protein [Pontivivens ytuae]|uniref:Radical SAM protein n=1 Tax=Pontivivens ytuae TaxID=2789856 RepID=A0A7S9LTW2_9RHOB|nr:radical SAM protein [Pontivivens ytuae]QPH54660.1 radical SAM protein [Pontivivens ytuae]